MLGPSLLNLWSGGGARSMGSRSREYAVECWKHINKTLAFLSSLVIPGRRRPPPKRRLVLRLPSNHTLTSNSSVTYIVDKVNELYEDMSELILSNLHDVQKSLNFWQSCAEGTDAHKLHFMVFERGPRAFIEGTMQVVRGFISEDSPIQHLAIAAASEISERVAVLTALQTYLAIFLAQVHKLFDSFGDPTARELDRKAITSLLVSIYSAMIGMGCRDNLPQSDSSVATDGCHIPPIVFQFEPLPEEHQGKLEWTDAEIQQVVTLLYSNLRRLNQSSSLVVSKYRRPRRAARLWIRYTVAAIGLTACSGWLLRHSKLMGCTDLDNWLKEGKKSIIAFWRDHVELPLVSIRNELFETFRRRHQGVMELEEVQLTANSLQRMLVAFSEQTTGKKLPEGASEQEMMEIMMARYEKELTHPLQNLLGGELARALLIQVQKLKLDIETAMLELNQILRANEINFAILAALPAFFMTVVLAALVQMWFVKDKGAEGKGRTARLQRRLLVVEVEKKIMQCHAFLDERNEKNALQSFGMILYTLDRLYKVTERHAKASGEWRCLHADILDLANPKLSVQFKLAITARMTHAYECLLPSSQRLL